MIIQSLGQLHLLRFHFRCSDTFRTIPTDPVHLSLLHLLFVTGISGSQPVDECHIFGGHFGGSYDGQFDSAIDDGWCVDLVDWRVEQQRG